MQVLVLRSAVEELPCCMFVSVEACTEALACRQALEGHRLALEEHRRVPEVEEACMLVWLEEEACMQVWLEEEACMLALLVEEVCMLVW